MEASALRFLLLCLVGIVGLSGQSLGQTPKLRWGTDPTGGAPYIFKDKKTGEYTGFEKDVADYLAEKLGREAEMVSGDWANLPQQLNKPADVAGGVDIVLNGYELRKDLSTQYGVTRAYYVYRLSLVVGAETGIQGWDDLSGKSVGVLGGTVAHRYLKKRYGKAGRFLPLLSIDLKTNPDVANVMKLVNDGRMDATVQDGPAASYFLQEYPDLKLAGGPVQPGELPGYYVIYYRKTDEEFGRQLDAAIAEGLRSGAFQKIYEKYGLWNADQESLTAELDKPWPPANLPEEESQWPELIGELVVAAGMTILLALLSFPLAMLIGFFVGMARVYGPRWLSVPCALYVEVLRGTPLLLQLFFIYYMIPELFSRAGHANLIGWLSPFVAGVLGLAINYSAYEAEIYRSGFLAVPKGQMEAALSLGMTRWTAIRRVTAPQAFRVVIPPVTNDFIALFKDTSACSIIFVTELTRKYNELFNFNRTLIVELAFLTAALYLMMSYPLALLARRLERRLSSTKEVGA
nr:ABC transporter permease subunit [Zavarzinella formosa]